MTLVAATGSCLFYYDPRYGHLPIIGGDPVHSRASAAYWLDQPRRLRSAIVHTPRVEWAQVYGDPKAPAVLSDSRPVLRLERSGTNLISVDFSAWTNNSVTVTTSQPDPAGGTAASLLNATVGGGYRARTVAFTGDATKAPAIALRQGTAAVSAFGLHDDTAGSWLMLVGITWNGTAAPTLAVLAGAGLLPVPVQAADGYWIVRFTANSAVAAHTNTLFLYPAGTTGTGTCYADLPQAEDAPAPSSLIGVGATRAVDAFNFAMSPTPVAMAGYVRFLDDGSALMTATNPRILSICDAVDSAPRLLLYNNGTSYALLHDNGTTSVSSVVALATVGETVELAWLVYANGSVRLILSRNGAAVSGDGGQSSANTFAAAWSASKLWLNGSAVKGQTRFANVKICKQGDLVATTAQGIMDELRAFELDAAGNQL